MFVYISLDYSGYNKQHSEWALLSTSPCAVKNRSIFLDESVCKCDFRKIYILYGKIVQLPLSRHLQNLILLIKPCFIAKTAEVQKIEVSSNCSQKRVKWPCGYGSSVIRCKCFFTELQFHKLFFFFFLIYLYKDAALVHVLRVQYEILVQNSNPAVKAFEKMELGLHLGF